MNEQELQQQNDLKQQLEKAQNMLKLANQDWAEDDTDIRNICRPIIGKLNCDGNSSGVPNVTDVVACAIKALCTQFEEAQRQLAAFHAAMERERKPDWEKWLMDLADRLDNFNSYGALNQAYDLALAARQLRSMATDFTLKANFVPAELRIKELEQEIAAIETGIRNEFTIGETSGDVLQDFATFVEHHNALELLHKELGKQLDEAQLALNNANWLIGDQANKNDKLVASLNQQLEEAQKQVAQLKEALLGWRKYFQSDIPKNADQQDQQGEEFTHAWFEMEQALSSTPSPDFIHFQMPKLMPATAKLVLDFAKAMADKLAAAELKYGYGDAWATPDAEDWPNPLCYERLMEHLAKGDPRDVVNYCAFLWFHKLSTKPCLKDFIHKRELAFRKPVNFAQDQWDALTPATQKAILWDELQDHLESLTKEP